MDGTAETKPVSNREQLAAAKTLLQDLKAKVNEAMQGGNEQMQRDVAIYQKARAAEIEMALNAQIKPLVAEQTRLQEEIRRLDRAILVDEVAALVLATMRASA